MNWNSTEGIGRHPITISFARKVGTLMTELSDNQTPNPSYRFYEESLLRRLPFWAISRHARDHFVDAAKPDDASFAGDANGAEVKRDRMPSG
jgi:hypothetical protein